MKNADILHTTTAFMYYPKSGSKLVCELILHDFNRKLLSRLDGFMWLERNYYDQDVIHEGDS